MKRRQQLAIDLSRKIPDCMVGVDFGHGCLMVDNRIFAFTRSDESAALKLPEARIAELLAGDGEMYNLTMGQRTMREWIVVPNIIAPANLPLLIEARAYLASLPQEKRRKPTKKSSKKAVKKIAAKTAKKSTKKATRTR
ncbi:MAG TPA: hypothetical protein VFS41_00180 [Edaphobacter sp.]|nr:hypothetical protein [Edaphobacter sp.]